MGISSVIEKLRRWKLRRYVTSLQSRGLSLGRNVFLNDGFFLDPSHCHLIAIEDNVVFGPGVRIFAHDASSLKVCGKTKIAPVRIKKNSFVGAFSVILPGAVVGENAIIAAHSTVIQAIPDNEVWGGTPARYLMALEDYRRRLEREPSPEFSEREFSQKALTPLRRKQMIDELERAGSGFMKP